jgi:uncharacterized protein
MQVGQIDIPMDQVEAFCRRWKIQELSIFGSALREDFRPDSDVDVLVAFERDHDWSLFDLVDMKDELRSMLGRKVDLLTRGGLRNPFRRHEILRTRQVIYDA